MKHILTVVILAITMSVNAQTICTKIVPYFEKLATTTEKVLVKEAVYRYDMIPEVLPLYEYVTNNIVICDSYDKVTRKPDGTYCVTTVEAVIRSVPSTKVLREGQPPQWIKILVTPAVYEDIAICKKIKDGKLVTVNAVCD